ncbi:radical SAM protein, partial [bacterium]|nr:radical SAM protein [bacterium]
MPLLREQPIQIDSPVQRQPELTDPHGRKIGYLRLSLTKSCAMRCLYCRPTTLENPRENYLRTDEITSLIKWLDEHYGLNKVRLTGGDPTNRPDILKIIESIS